MCSCVSKWSLTLSLLISTIEHLHTSFDWLRIQSSAFSTQFWINIGIINCLSAVQLSLTCARYPTDLQTHSCFRPKCNTMARQTVEVALWIGPYLLRADMFVDLVAVSIDAMIV